ncbi:LytTR family transcriptional regulator DNA-binding domain-containing protein [Paenibacillus dendritiformis]|uniref:LytTR family transcriptional regulator DNA-binding domain-containing protein n=1 Tax=Paenibacillus dendritiformis TaxID=130049 RepID=UPI0031F50800
MNVPDELHLWFIRDFLRHEDGIIRPGSYLVNLQQVREIEAWTKDSYILKLDVKTGSTVPLSRSKYMELKGQFKI